MSLKKLAFNAPLRSTKVVDVYQREKVFTNDKETVELNFTVTDMAAEDLTTATAEVLLYMKDGSFFQVTDVTKTDNVFTYVMSDTQGKHPGLAKTQLVVTIGTKKYASQLFEFFVNAGLDGIVANEVMIQDWTTLTAEARDFIDQAELDEAQRIANEEARVLAENQRINDFSSKADKTYVDDQDDALAAQLADIEQKVDVDIPTQLNDKAMQTDVDKILSKSTNLFDKTAIVASNIVSYDTGDLVYSASYDASDYITVKGGTQYTLKYGGFSGVWYDANKVRISASNSATLVSPINAKYFRMGILKTNVATQQFNEGNVLLPYENYYVHLSHAIRVDEENLGEQTIEQRLLSKKRLYSISDAIVKWRLGEKFPIAFMGDSTTDGFTVTGYTANVLGTDHIQANAYPYLLEQKLRAYTGNNILRVYNAGFSGTNTTSGLANIEANIANNVHYSDVKMIGIMYGINDRTTPIEIFKNNLKSLLLWCYDHDIQPFLITPQMITQRDLVESPTQSARYLSTVIVRAIKDIAEMYNIELIDNNFATQRFISFSKTITTDVLPDTLHFGDRGHRFEAEFLFSKLIGDTLIIESDAKISPFNPFVSQTGYDRNMVTQEAITFRRYIRYYEVNTTSEVLVCRAYVLNFAEGQLELSVDVSAPSNFYFKVNGVTYAIGDKPILEIGSHTIEIYAGVNTVGNYYGFSFKKV